MYSPGKEREGMKRLLPKRAASELLVTQSRRRGERKGKGG